MTVFLIICIVYFLFNMGTIYNGLISIVCGLGGLIATGLSFKNEKYLIYAMISLTILGIFTIIKVLMKRNSDYYGILTHLVFCFGLVTYWYFNFNNILHFN